MSDVSLLTLFKALADETRLRLVDVLEQGEFTVQELTEILHMGQSRVSRHLKILLESGILDVKREGTWAYYRLAPTHRVFREQLPLLRPHLKNMPTSQVDNGTIVSVLSRRRQRSQMFFEQHARHWDQIAENYLPTPDYTEALLSAIGSPGTVAEIGFGTGRLLNSLGDSAQRVIGIDHSPAMLEVARERIEAEKRTNVELRLGEMDHLPLENRSVDVLVLNMVLHHAAAPEKVILEAARVLVQGGMLEIVDLERHQSEWVREKLADQWLGFTRRELEGWLERGGFGILECTLIRGDNKQFPVLHVRAKYQHAD